MPSLFLIKFLACYSAKQSCVPNLILLDSVVAKINRGSQKFLDPSPPLTCIHFYRATCMHSADYAVAICLSVRLSVWLSYAGIVSKRLSLTHILKRFTPSGSPTILVLPHQTKWQYSDGNTLNEGVECKGVWKKSQFLTNISLYLGIDAR